MSFFICDKFDTKRKIIVIFVFYVGLKRVKDILKIDICNGFDDWLEGTMMD